MGRLRSLVRLGRAHFLLGGALMFALGAFSAGRIETAGYLLGQAMVTASQVTAHFVNEYADVEVDRAVTNRTMFSGGSGVLSEGVLEPSVALRAAYVTSVACVLLAVTLASRAPLAAGVGLVTLAVSWAYSLPPVRLLGTGFGELATSVTVAALVPIIGVAAMGDAPTTALWWAIATLVPVHVAMMLGFELPDLATDAAVGKRVLAVRIGAERTRIVIVALLATAAAVGVIGEAAGGLPGGRIAVTIGVLPAAVMLSAIRQEKHAVTTGAAVATLVAVAGTLLAAAI